MKFEQFVGPAYSLPNINANNQRCVNWYVRRDEAGSGKNTAYLVPTPGLQLFADLGGSDDIRGLFGGDGRLFVVHGTQLKEIDHTGTVIATRGGITAGSDVAQIIPNGFGRLIVAGNRAHWDNGTSITPLNFHSSSTPVNASTGCIVDGYFFVNTPNTRVFQRSDLLDGSKWEAVMKASKEGYPDNIVAVFADSADLWVFGSETTEVWRNTARNDFSFERNSAAFLQFGLVAKWSPASIAGGVAFIGTDKRGGPIAYLTSGYHPRRISNHAVEERWKSANMFNAVGFAYTENGHQFYVVTLPGSFTWAYDVTTGLWHERGVWTGSDFTSARYRLHAFMPGWGGIAGTHIVAAATGGKLYRMSEAYRSDAGEPIRRLRTSPNMCDERKWIAYQRFELDMDSGAWIGGSSPQILLSWSADDGVTFSTPLPSPVDISTAHDRRVVWRRLGKGRERIWKVECQGDSYFSIANAYLEAKVL